MARALRSADGSAMRGDFTLVHPSGTSLAVMVVDVSGHGIDVGPRAVQLAGAFGGLMGEVQPSRLMGACNDYLVRQGWERHYATAAHVVIDLATGEATVRAAGHPAPKVRRRDSSWTAVPAHGPLFGLVPEVEYGGVRVQMAAGDTLVVVSDGALDERSDDAWAGVVRAVDLWTDSGQPGGTQEVPKEAYLSSDDQTIVAIHRKSGR
jgi:serine phosphatase RsbU (regulator of sigma subunit)